MAMEIVRRDEVCLKENSISRSSRGAKITLEDYLRFFDSSSSSDFSMNCLNQIIAMHGYKKIHKTPMVLIEAVGAIALMNPCRSTLNDEYSLSDSTETMESIINDLSELKWQECTVTSIEFIGSNLANASSSSSAAAATAAAAAASGAPAGTKKRRAKGSKDKVKERRTVLRPIENECKQSKVVAKRKKKL